MTAPVTDLKTLFDHLLVGDDVQITVTWLTMADTTDGFKVTPVRVLEFRRRDANGRWCRNWEARLVCNRDHWETPGETPRLLADLAAAFGRHVERSADLPVQGEPRPGQCPITVANCNEPACAEGCKRLLAVQGEPAND